eukprot:gene2959-3401_t
MPAVTVAAASTASPTTVQIKTTTITSPTTRATAQMQAQAQAALEEENRPNAIQYHCDYCQKDISNVVRIRCSVCEDFDLCLECFSVGVEIYPHKNDHDYHVVDNMHFPMFTEEWGADEELLLLEGIELYGMGNWNDVSDNVGHKSPAECKQHYFTFYLNSSTSPLPDVTKVLTNSDNVHFKRAKSTNYNPNDRKPRSAAAPESSEGPSGPVTDSVGFMKNRGHFEYEFDNDAEVVVKDLVFETEDSPDDRETKLNVLEAYNQRLDERVRRRNFILDKGLLDYKKTERNLGRHKEDKEVYNSMKVFLQAMTKEDHEKLVKGMIEEKVIKARIELLQQWRMNGLRTLVDGQQYEEDKRKRDAERNLRKAKSDLSYHEKPSTIKTQKTVIKEKEDSYLGLKGKFAKLPKNLDDEMVGLPNVDALSLSEKKMCFAIRVLPHQYLLIKEQLLAESAKNNGRLKFSQAAKMFKLETSKVAKIIEYMEASGWVKRDDGSY